MLFAQVVAYGLSIYGVVQAARVCLTDDGRILLRRTLHSGSAIVGSIVVFAIN